MWVVVDAVNDNFYAVDLEFGSLHATGEDVGEGEVEESGDVFVDVIAAIQQDRLYKFTSADTIGFTKSIASHDLWNH